MGKDYPPLELTLQRNGCFSSPGSIHAGDDYGAKDRYRMARYEGKQMASPFPTSGRNPDAYIDKEFKRLSENDVYLDPSQVARNLLKREGKNVSEKAFLPSSPAPRYAILPHSAGPSHTESMRSSGPAPKNFLTSRPMAGGFGRTGHFIGKSNEYMPDEFLRGRIVEKEEKAKAREKINKPFMALKMGSKTGLFHTNVYVQEPGPAYRETKKKELANPKPFRQPGPAKSGAINTFSSNEYMEDPLEEKIAREKAQKLAAAPKYGGFKAIDCLHSNYTRAINPYKEPERKKPAVEVLW
mmetsp:Transcript_39769/g.66724  ORF Transcript_39769/g.66724 Transcript_39769/m.66724 type:complete len:297 (-) Transcript_39769:52-942(-)